MKFETTTVTKEKLQEVADMINEFAALHLINSSIYDWGDGRTSHIHHKTYRNPICLASTDHSCIIMRFFDTEKHGESINVDDQISFHEEYICRKMPKSFTLKPATAYYFPAGRSPIKENTFY